MRQSIILFMAILFVMQANASSYFGLPGSEDSRQAIFVEKIEIQADKDGTFHEPTDNPLIGNLKAVILENGNYTHIGTYNLNYSIPGNISLDSYNISSGSTTRAPLIKVAGSTDSYSSYPLFGKLWLNITGGQAWGQATAYIVYG
jgi:hypothetical protein